MCRRKNKLRVNNWSPTVMPHLIVPRSLQWHLPGNGINRRITTSHNSQLISLTSDGVHTGTGSRRRRSCILCHQLRYRKTAVRKEKPRWLSRCGGSGRRFWGLRWRWLGFLRGRRRRIFSDWRLRLRWKRHGRYHGRKEGRKGKDGIDLALRRLGVWLRLRMGRWHKGRHLRRKGTRKWHRWHGPRRRK